MHKKFEVGGFGPWASEWLPSKLGGGNKENPMKIRGEPNVGPLRRNHMRANRDESNKGVSGGISGVQTSVQLLKLPLAW